jgi:ankyrin repeat protein
MDVIYIRERHCLLFSGVISNRLDDNGFTCIMNAVKSGYIEVLEALVDKIDANVICANPREEDGFTLGHLALISQNPRILGWLIENNSKFKNPIDFKIRAKVNQ